MSESFRDEMLEVTVKWIKKGETNDTICASMTNLMAEDLAAAHAIIKREKDEIAAAAEKAEVPDAA